MRTRILTAAVFALASAAATLAAPDTARAAGVGIYGTLGAGVANWHDSAFGDFDDRNDTRHGGAGLVLDTASPYRPLSYRLSVGWERATLEGERGAADLELEGVVVDQDLNLQLFLPPGPLRIWAGPELRLGLFNGSMDGVDGDEDFLAVGLGPVFGFDFAVSPAVAISWKFGYLFTAYSGNGRSSSIEDSSIGEGHAYATMAILFSPGGGYQRQPPPVQRQYEPQPRYNPRRW